MRPAAVALLSSRTVDFIAIFSDALVFGWGLNGACDNDMNTTPPNTGEFGQRAAPPRLIVPKSANEALRPEAGTPPPRRSRQSRNQIVVFLNFIITAMMVGAIGGGVLAYYGKQQFEQPGPSTSRDHRADQAEDRHPGHRRPAAASWSDHRRPRFLAWRQRLWQ